MLSFPTPPLSPPHLLLGIHFERSNLLLVVRCASQASFTSDIYISCARARRILFKPSSFLYTTCMCVCMYVCVVCVCVCVCVYFLHYFVVVRILYDDNCMFFSISAHIDYTLSKSLYGKITIMVHFYKSLITI